MPALPGSHTRGAGSLRHRGDPPFGDHRFSIGYVGQTNCLSCHHLDGRISTRDPGDIDSRQASVLRGGLNLGDLSHWTPKIIQILSGPLPRSTSWTSGAVGHKQRTGPGGGHPPGAGEIPAGAGHQLLFHRPGRSA